MISERAFSEGFHGFWRELLPLLTPAFIRILNSGHQEELCGKDGRPLGPVPARNDSRNSSVVAEFAYNLAAAAIHEAASVEAASGNPGILLAAQTKAIARVNRLEGYDAFPDVRLNRAEIWEGVALAARYEAFFRETRAEGEIRFGVPIPGAGFLSACEADVTVGDCLVEVKTVSRALASKDVRQLVVYLALAASGSAGRWPNAGFLNPRRSTYYWFTVQELVEYMAGGRAATDVYADLIEFACSSDVQIDARF